MENYITVVYGLLVVRIENPNEKHFYKIRQQARDVYNIMGSIVNIFRRTNLRDGGSSLLHLNTINVLVYNTIFVILGDFQSPNLMTV